MNLRRAIIQPAKELIGDLADSHSIFSSWRTDLFSAGEGT
jgi:hypothetical protein